MTRPIRFFQDDVAEANAVGIYSVWGNRGGEEVTEVMPDPEIRLLTELLDLL